MLTGKLEVDHANFRGSDYVLTRSSLSMCARLESSGKAREIKKQPEDAPTVENSTEPNSCIPHTNCMVGQTCRFAHPR